MTEHMAGWVGELGSERNRRQGGRIWGRLRPNFGRFPVATLRLFSRVGLDTRKYGQAVQFNKREVWSWSNVLGCLAT